MTQPPSSPTTARPGHLPIRPEWLALRDEEILEPERPIVDAHHHLWNRDGHQYFLEELIDDTSTGHNVVATVFVECHAMYRTDGPEEMKPVGEVEFVERITAPSTNAGFTGPRAAAAIIGYADLGLGAEVESVLDAEIAASGGRFRGVRNSSVWHPDPRAHGSSVDSPPDRLKQPAFREGLKCLTEKGLSLDAWMYHTQLNDLVELARAMPDANIVMNHVGGAIGIGPYEGKRDEVFAQWCKGVTAVAECPNVSVKLGGLGMRLFGFDVHLGEKPPTSVELAVAWRPYIETCIEVFGAERAMFESNFPVDKGSCTYQSLWNAFKRITAGASDTEKHALFGGTAAKVYGFTF